MNEKRYPLSIGIRLLVIVLSGAVVSSAVASEMGTAAANQVTDATYRYFLGDRFGVPGILYTHTGDSRGVGAPQHELAKQNIADHFAAYGLTVTLEPVSYSGGTYYNVVGTRLGAIHPDQEIVIGAHYDSVSNPGADDNASGVSLVLECARIITQYESDYTIRFIAFTREEQGLYGSEAYVAAHGDDDILAMISADMVAYDTGSNQARLYGRTGSAVMAALGAAIVEYGNGLTWMDAGWISASNHAPFDEGGFDACLLIEGDVWDNPYYHTQQDSVDNPNNINYEYALKMTRSAVGYLVDAAGVIVDADYLKFEYPDGQPEYSLPSGGTTVRVEVIGVGAAVPQPGTGMLHYNVGAGWESAPLVVVADNVYDAVLPPGDCGGELLYYVSAEAVGGEVFTDPYGAPTTTHAAIVAYGLATFYENTFDSDPGWTTEGAWAFGQPTGQGGEYGEADPNSGYTGNNVYGYNLNGDYDNNMPERHLTSTAIDCTGMFGVQLSFWRWLGVEKPQYDHAYVRVSADGMSWTTVWENTATMEAGAWEPMDIDISAIADDQPTVYLRWTMGMTDTSWRYCGWNVDDVRLTALDCTSPLCAGDVDCSGVVDYADIDAFVEALNHPGGAGWPHACPWLNADCDGDGDVTYADIDPFVGRIGAVCP